MDAFSRPQTSSGGQMLGWCNDNGACRWLSSSSVVFEPGPTRNFFTRSFGPTFPTSDAKFSVYMGE